jgi:hypothetical protein
VKGYVTQKGDRWYAVIYEGLDPVTGKGRRSWHPAGTCREDGERLAARLAKELDGRNDEGRSLTFGAYLATRWLPGKKLELARSTWDGYRRKIERHILPTLGKVPIRRVRRPHRVPHPRRHRSNTRFRRRRPPDRSRRRTTRRLSPHRRPRDLPAPQLQQDHVDDSHPPGQGRRLGSTTVARRQDGIPVQDHLNDTHPMNRTGSSNRLTRPTQRPTPQLRPRRDPAVAPERLRAWRILG